MKALDRLETVAGIKPEVEESRGISDGTWDGMKESQRKKYIKDHPHSRFAKDPKDAPKVKPVDGFSKALNKLADDTKREIKIYIKKLEAEKQAIDNEDWKLADKLSDFRSKYYMDHLVYTAMHDKDVKDVMSFINKKYKDLF